jgi:hypothetical protein
MSLQKHEIGLEACPPSRPGNPVAGVPENCNIEFGLWKPNTYSYIVGDQGECTMEKEVRRHKKMDLGLAIAEGESIAAWARENGVPERAAFYWAKDPKNRSLGTKPNQQLGRSERLTRPERLPSGSNPGILDSSGAAA